MRTTGTSCGALSSHVRCPPLTLEPLNITRCSTSTRRSKIQNRHKNLSIVIKVETPPFSEGTPSSLGGYKPPAISLSAPDAMCTCSYDYRNSCGHYAPITKGYILPCEKVKGNLLDPDTLKHTCWPYNARNASRTERNFCCSAKCCAERRLEQRRLESVAQKIAAQFTEQLKAGEQRFSLGTKAMERKRDDALSALQKYNDTHMAQHPFTKGDCEARREEADLELGVKRVRISYIAGLNLFGDVKVLDT